MKRFEKDNENVQIVTWSMLGVVYAVAVAIKLRRRMQEGE